MKFRESGNETNRLDVTVNHLRKHPGVEIFERIGRLPQLMK